MSRKTRAYDRHRKEWMRDYEQLMISANLAEPGKVDWDTAFFYFNQGWTPASAVEKQMPGHKEAS
ncbi:MAG TPA: hypothetical protein ENJ35_04355 [Gammaproteobacteria bacterium]|nr:hypothetical protein [Gammaproteobacteria bacterium]